MDSITVLNGKSKLVHPFIVNGREYDPMTYRLQWEQYFPPRRDWIMSARHRRPESRPVKRPKTVHSTRIDNPVEQYMAINEESEPAIHAINSELLSDASVESGVHVKVDASKGKRKKRSHGRKAPGKKLHSSKTFITQEYTVERAKTEPVLTTAVTEAVKMDGPLVKKKKKRQIKKPPLNKNIKPHKQINTTTNISGVKRKSHSKSSLEAPQGFQRGISLNKVPRLPIPDSWKWRGKTRSIDKVQPLPLPTSWVWYNDPNQFKKRPAPPSVSSSSDRTDTPVITSAAPKQKRSCGRTTRQLSSAI